jgi:phage terminase large subunit GpA
MGFGVEYLKKRAMELATPATRAINDPLAAWALRKIRLDGRPFSFDGHEYLRAIYDDTSPHVVLSKAAQIGGTTWAILRAFHACLSGLDAIYFFPTRTDVIDFSRSRVGPLLYDNPFLGNQVRDTDTVGLKRIGEGHLYFRGMQSSVGMKSVPADMIVFDELDEATPDARTLAWERIAHSSYKRVIELSNPSLPGYGIDEQYEKSDQRHWTLKCPGCNHWTALEREFPTKLGQEVKIILPREDGMFYRACPRCAHELDLAQGEWVADCPDRKIQGYRISQLFSTMVDPGEILYEYRNTNHPDRFYNLKIGIPWADLERRLDIASVLALVGGSVPVSDRPRRFMGVDTGRQLHVVILERPKEAEPAYLIHLGVVEGFQDLDELMRRFQVRGCVIDGLPETHATREFAKGQGSKVHMCFFSESQVGSARWDHHAHTVHVNRTEALDASRAVVRDKRLVIPQGLPLIHDFAKHMVADAKVLHEDEETGVKKYRYIKAGGEDHFSLAFTYAVLAMSTTSFEPAVAFSTFSPRAAAMARVHGGNTFARYGYGPEDEELIRRIQAGRNGGSES